MSAMARLVAGPLAIERLQAEVAAPECGATCTFLGTVRSGPEEAAHGGVRGIEYSAYEAMAEAELARIVGEALARWAGARVALGHRLGLVPVGEASIAIAVAAPHRAAAFEACRYVIEEVKRRVPIWKREIHADGTAVWVDAHGRPAEAPR
jgi:molybdopterin synthase catalytic subunit